MGAEYEFRLAGHIDPGALTGFDGLSIVPGTSDTLMRGEVTGQSAVFAILARLHAMGLTLLELRRTESAGTDRVPGPTSRAPATDPPAAIGSPGPGPRPVRDPRPAVPPPGQNRHAEDPHAAVAPAAPDDAAGSPTGLPVDLPVDLPASIALMIGLMAGVTEGAVAGLRQTGTAVRPLGRPAATIWRLLPGSEGVSRTARERADMATARGRTEFAAAVSFAERAWSSALNRIGEDPNVSQMVGKLADRVLNPIVDAALPMVLDRLAAEPQNVRQILGVQSFGMAEEVTDTIRERSAAADDQVERFAHRLMHRRGRQTSASTSAPLPHEA